MRRQEHVGQVTFVSALLIAGSGWVSGAAEAQIPEPPAPYPVLDQPDPQATPVPAPVEPAPAALPPSSRFSLGATLAFTYHAQTRSSQTVSVPVLQARYNITPYVATDLDWGFALGLDSEGSATVRTGNPWLKGWYQGERGQLRWQAGIGVSLPLAAVNLGSEGRLQRGLYDQSAAAWGLWDIWRWTPGRMAIPIPAGLSYEVSPGMLLTSDLALAPVMGVNNGQSGTELLGQIAVGSRFLLTHNLWLCPGLQAVLLPSTSVDRLQTAAGLRMEWMPSLGRFFLGALVSLDEPVGIFGRGTHGWGIHLGKELGQ
jgi:hypothetical protein